MSTPVPAAATQAIQDKFQQYVLGTDAVQPAILADIREQFGLPATERLAIYYNAYRIRIRDALAEAREYVSHLKPTWLQTISESCAPDEDWAAPRFPDSGIGAISCCTLPVQVLVVNFLRSPVAER